MVGRYLSALALALTFILTGPASAAHASKNFSGFKGTYTGTAYGTIANTAATGTVTARITVPKNGKSMVVNLSGQVFDGQATYPVSATISLANGVASSSNALFLATQPTPASGTYAITSARAFQYTESLGTVLSATNTFAITPHGKKQTITFTSVNQALGRTLTFVFTLSGKAPARK